jgi:LmbE family N-acetylglucosaminyl deacetylase
MKTLSRRELLGAGVMAASGAAVVAADRAITEKQSVAPGKKIVVTGGHPGDPEYGCGGTIARLADLGHDIVLLYLNRGDPNETPGQVSFPRVAEAARACEILKARPVYAGQIDGHAIVDGAHYEAFRQITAREKPDALFTQWPVDNHADHRAISLLSYDAWLHLKKSFALYYYEVSNGEDTTCFTPTHYVDISATADRKRRACFAHASQSPDRYYGLQQTVAKFRGIESGAREAEAFIHHAQSPTFPLPSKHD